MKQLLITYKSFDELTSQQQKTVLDNNREILFGANYHQPILDNMKSFSDLDDIIQAEIKKQVNK